MNEFEYVRDWIDPSEGNLVLTMGSFDLFHVGHLSLLRTCKAIAGPNGHVAVGVNSNKFMADFKREPAIPHAERIDIVQSCEYVDLTFTVEEHDAKPWLEYFKPRFLVIGSDWAPPKDYHAQLRTTSEWLTENGITLLYVERETGQSTTRIRKEMGLD